MFNQILLETLIILILKNNIYFTNCFNYKSYIFLWQEKTSKYELQKINVDGDIDSLIQVGENQILELLTRKINLF